MNRFGIRGILLIAVLSIATCIASCIIFVNQSSYENNNQQITIQDSNKALKDGNLLAGEEGDWLSCGEDGFNLQSIDVSSTSVDEEQNLINVGSEGDVSINYRTDAPIILQDIINNHITLRLGYRIIGLEIDDSAHDGSCCAYGSGWRKNPGIAKTLYTEGEFTSDINTSRNKHGTVTISPVWEAIEYRISYNLGGKQVEENLLTPTSYSTESQSATDLDISAENEYKNYITLPNINTKFYGFNGWTVSGSVGFSSIKTIGGVSHNIIIYADTQNSYRHTFIMDENSKLKYLLTGEVRDDSGNFIGSYGDLELTANWSPLEYQVTYIIDKDNNELLQGVDQNSDLIKIEESDQKFEGYVGKYKYEETYTAMASVKLKTITKNGIVNNNWYIFIVSASNSGFPNGVTQTQDFSECAGDIIVTGQWDNQIILNINAPGYESDATFNDESVAGNWSLNENRTQLIYKNELNESVIIPTVQTGTQHYVHSGWMFEGNEVCIQNDSESFSKDGGYGFTITKDDAGYKISGASGVIILDMVWTIKEYTVILNATDGGSFKQVAWWTDNHDKWDFDSSSSSFSKKFSAFSKYFNYLPTGDYLADDGSQPLYSGLNDFGGWWTLNGTDNDDWGTEITSSSVLETDMLNLYIKWLPKDVIMLDLNDERASFDKNVVEKIEGKYIVGKWTICNADGTIDVNEENSFRYAKLDFNDSITVSKEIFDDVRTKDFYDNGKLQELVNWWYYKCVYDRAVDSEEDKPEWEEGKYYRLNNKQYVLISSETMFNKYTGRLYSKSNILPNGDTISRATTFYAIWEGLKINITLDLGESKIGNPKFDKTVEELQTDGWQYVKNDDSSDNTHKIIKQVVYGSPFKLPAGVRNGYEFTYWEDENNNKYVSNESIVFTATNDLYLTACFNPINYTITLKPGEGSFNGNEIVEGSGFKYNISNGYYQLTYQITSKVVLPQIAVPEKRVAVWTVEAASGTWSGNYSPSVEISEQYEDVSLIATWSNNSYKLTIDSNGGVFTRAPIGWSTDGSQAPFRIINKQVEFGTNLSQELTTVQSQLNRAGCTFAGWYYIVEDRELGSIEQELSSTFTMPAYNLNLYARWVLPSYNLVLNANLGGFSEDDLINGWEVHERDASNRIVSIKKLVEIDAYITEPEVGVNSNVPWRGGYVFMGWYTAETNHGYIFTDDPVTALTQMPNKDTTYYAKWESGRKTITIYSEDEDIDIEYDIFSATEWRYDRENGLYMISDATWTSYDLDIPGLTANGRDIYLKGYHNTITGINYAERLKNGEWSQLTVGAETFDVVTYDGERNYKYIFKATKTIYDDVEYYSYMSLMEGSFGDIELQTVIRPKTYTVTYYDTNKVKLEQDLLSEDATIGYDYGQPIYLSTKAGQLSVAKWKLMSCDGDWYGLSNGNVFDSGININNGEYYGNVQLVIDSISSNNSIYIDPRGGDYDGTAGNIHQYSSDPLIYVVYGDSSNNFSLKPFSKNGYGKVKEFYGFVKKMSVSSTDTNLYKLKAGYNINNPITLDDAQSCFDSIDYNNVTSGDLQSELIYQYKVVSALSPTQFIAFNTLYCEYGPAIEYSIEYYVNGVKMDANGNPSKFTIESDDLELTNLASAAYPAGYTHKMIDSAGVKKPIYKVVENNGSFTAGDELHCIYKGSFLDYIDEGLNVLKLQAELELINYTITYLIPEQNQNPNDETTEFHDSNSVTSFNITTEQSILITDDNKQNLFGDRDDQNAITLLGWIIDVSEANNVEFGEVVDNKISYALKDANGSILGYYILKVAIDRDGQIIKDDTDNYVVTEILQGSYGNIALRGVFEVKQFNIQYQVVKAGTNPEELESLSSITINGTEEILDNISSYTYSYTYYDTIYLADSVTITDGPTSVINEWTASRYDVEAASQSNWGVASNTVYGVKDAGGQLLAISNKYGNVVLKASLQSWDATKLTLYIRPQMNYNSGADALATEEIDLLKATSGVEGVDVAGWKKIMLDMSPTSDPIDLTSIEGLTYNGYKINGWIILKNDDSAINNAPYKEVEKDGDYYTSIKCSNAVTLVVNAELVNYNIEYYKLSTITWDANGIETAEELTDQLQDIETTFNIEGRTILANLDNNTNNLKINGYIFDNWRIPQNTGSFTNTGENSIVKDSISGWLDNEGDTLKLYAYYNLFNYTITYLMPNNSGEGATTEKLDLGDDYNKYNIRSGLTIPTEITKQGYTFDGWIVVGANGDNAVNFSNYDNQYVEYTSNSFAVDSQDATSYFKLSATQSGGKYLCSTIESGSYGNIILRAVITPIEYHIDMDGSNNNALNSTDYGKIAQNNEWQLTDSAYNALTGGESESQYARSNYNIETNIADNIAFVLPTSEQTTRTGYTFKGWQIASGYTSVTYSPDNNNVTYTLTSGDEVKLNTIKDEDDSDLYYCISVITGSYGNVKFIAIWQINEYNLIFDANGGRIARNDVEYILKDKDDVTDNWVDVGVDAEYADGAFKLLEYGTDYLSKLITDESALIRYGYTFKGWYTQNGTDGEWGEYINPDDSSLAGEYLLSDDTTIYAKWEAITYTITYAYKSQTSDTSSVVIDSNKLPEGTKLSYTADETFSMPSYADGDGYWWFEYYVDQSGSKIDDFNLSVGNWHNTNHINSPMSYEYNYNILGMYGRVRVYTILSTSKITLTGATVLESAYSYANTTSLPKFDDKGEGVGELTFNSACGDLILPTASQILSTTGSSFEGWKFEATTGTLNVDDIADNKIRYTDDGLEYVLQVKENQTSATNTYFVIKVLQGSYGDITFDAVWEEHGYTINLISENLLDNEQLNKQTAISMSYSGETQINISAIFEEGNNIYNSYEFIGWVFETEYNNIKVNLNKYRYLYENINDIIKVNGNDYNNYSPIFKDGLTVSQLTSVENGEVKIYAVWMPKYSVRIEANGGKVYSNGVETNQEFINSFYNGFVLPTREESDDLFTTPTGEGVQLYREGYYIESWKVQVGEQIYYIDANAQEVLFPTPYEWQEWFSGSNAVASATNLQYLQGNITITPNWLGFRFTVRVIPHAFETIDGVNNPEITGENVETEIRYGDNYVIFDNASIGGYTLIGFDKLAGYTLTEATSAIGSKQIELIGAWEYKGIYKNAENKDGDNVVLAEVNATYSPNLYRIELQPNKPYNNASIEIKDDECGDFTKQETLAVEGMYRAIQLSGTSISGVDAYQANQRVLFTNSGRYYVYLLNGQQIRSYNEGASAGLQLPKFSTQYYKLQYYKVGDDLVGFRQYLMTENLMIDNVNNNVQSVDNISPAEWRLGYISNTEYDSSTNGNKFCFAAEWYREQANITVINQMKDKGDTSYGATIIAEIEQLTENATTPFRYHLIIRESVFGYGDIFRRYVSTSYEDLIDVLKGTKTVAVEISEIVNVYLGNKITVWGIDQRVFTTDKYKKEFVGVRFDNFEIKAKEQTLNYTIDNTENNKTQLDLDNLQQKDDLTNIISLVDQDAIQITTIFDYIKYSADFVVRDESNNNYNEVYGNIGLYNGSKQYKTTNKDSYTFEFTINDVNRFDMELSTGSELNSWMYGTTSLTDANGDVITGLSIEFNADFLVKHVYSTGLTNTNANQNISNISSICKFSEFEISITINNQVDGSLIKSYKLGDEGALDIFKLYSGHTSVTKATIGNYIIKLLESASNNMLTIDSKDYFLNQMYLAHNSTTSENQAIQNFKHNDKINDIDLMLTSDLLEKVVNYIQYNPVAQENRVLNFHLLVAPKVTINFVEGESEYKRDHGYIAVNGQEVFRFDYSTPTNTVITPYYAYVGQILTVGFNPNTEYYYTRANLSVKYGEDSKLSNELTINCNANQNLEINTEFDYTITVSFEARVLNFSSQLVVDGVVKESINGVIKTASGDIIFSNAQFVPNSEDYLYGDTIAFSYESGVTSGYKIEVGISSGSYVKNSDRNYTITFGSQDILLTVTITSTTSNVIITSNIVADLAVAEVVGVVNDNLELAQKVLTRKDINDNEFELRVGDKLDLYVKTYAGYKFDNQFTDPNSASNKIKYEVNPTLLADGEYEGYYKFNVISNYGTTPNEYNGVTLINSSLNQSGTYTLLFKEVEVSVAFKYYEGYMDNENYVAENEVTSVDWLTATSIDLEGTDAHIGLNANIPENYRLQEYTYRSNLGEADCVKLNIDADGKVELNNDMMAYIGEQEIKGTSENYYTEFIIYGNYINLYKVNVNVTGNISLTEKVTYTLKDNSETDVVQNQYYDSHSITINLTATTSDTLHYNLALKVNSVEITPTQTSATNNGNCAEFSWSNILDGNKDIEIIISSEQYNPTVNIKYSADGSNFIDQTGTSLAGANSYIHDNIAYKVINSTNSNATEQDLIYNANVTFSIIVARPTDSGDYYGLSKICIFGSEIDLTDSSKVEVISSQDNVEYKFNCKISGNTSDRIELYYTQYYKIDVQIKNVANLPAS